MSSYFLTGSSSGLGLAMATRLADLPSFKVSHIFATARTKSPALSKLCNQYPNRVLFISLDVTDDVSCEKAAAKVQMVVGDNGLDVVINNAAANPREDTYRMDDLEVTLNANVIGVRNVTRALIDLLKMGEEKKVVNMFVLQRDKLKEPWELIVARSSAMGSMALSNVFSFAPGAAYKVSKAALNMLTRQYALAFSEDAITFIAISPGYIKTKMGDEHDADLLPETSADAVLRAAWKASTEDSGRFIDIEVEGFEINGRRKYSGDDLPF
ncbi:putative short chain oxidoreductase [Venturia nashicola]|uniref:Putative short chain oxidoreductase n=1 Tax=Venturia nashicola TaxID=86259 RepID=A0A4Z1PUL1_9PEZI|nr:putative short chain oxidoreductase [Venturia nashicola]TLD38601.1 putative short chain oxidoreductase [Venturia nashicola]